MKRIFILLVPLKADGEHRGLVDQVLAQAAKIGRLGALMKKLMERFGASGACASPTAP